MEQSGTARPRRRFVRFLLVAVALIVVLIALAPTILSMGIARSIAENAIGDAINGKANVGSVSLGWFSNQEVGALDVQDDSGENAAKLDLSVHSGLLALATGGGRSLDLVLSGSIRGTIEKDGSIGFQKLAKPATGSGGAGSGGGSGGSGGKSGGSGSDVAANVLIKDLAIALTDKSSGKSYALSALNGTATFDGKARTAKVQLASPTELAGSKGSIELKVDLGSLPLAGDLGAMTIDLSLVAKDVSIPAGGLDAQFRTIQCAVKSPGFAERVAVTASAEGLVDGKTPSTLGVDLAVTKLVGQSGAVEFNPANVVGSIEAANLRTSLVQPSLAAANVVASEDIGPIIERLIVRAPGGTGEKVVVELVSEKANLTIGGIVNPTDRSLQQGTLDGTLRATPATLKRLAGAEVLGDVELRLAGRDLRWAASTVAGDPLANVVGTIEIQPSVPLVWKQPEPSADATDGGPKPIAIAVGSTTRISLSRESLDKPFFIDTKAALGLGSAKAPPTAPGAPNVALRSALLPAFKGVNNATITTDLPLEPAFLLAVSGKSFTKPTRLMVDVRDLDAAIGGGNPLAGLGIDGDVRLAGETSMYVEQLKRDVPLRDIAISLRGADVSKEAQLGLKGSVDAAVLDVNETVRNLPANLAGIDPLALDLRGTAKITGLNSGSLIAWLGQYREYIEAAGISELSIDLANEPSGTKPGEASGQRVTLALAGQPLHGNVVATVGPEAGSIERLELAGAAPEALARAVQSSSESKVIFAKDVPFTLALSRPTSFKFAELKDGKLPAGLSAKLTVAEAVVSAAPGIHGGLAIDGLDLVTDVDQSATSAKVKGSFALRGTTGPNARVERATLDLAWTKESEPSLLRGASGTVRLDGVNVPWIESLLGKDAGTYSKWTGDDGSLALKLERTGKAEHIQLVPTFPRITSGTVDVLAEGKGITASAKGVAVRVPAASLTELAAKPAPKHAGGPTEGPKYTFQSDLALTLNDATVSLPGALAEGDNRLAGGSVNVKLVAEPIVLNVVEPAKPVSTLKVPAIDLAVSSSDLFKGVSLEAKDRGEGAAGEATFRISGAVNGLADANGQFSAENAKLDLDTDVRDIPTVLVDLIAATGGKLTRSLGDRMAVKANAKNLSKTSGEFSAKVKSPFADLSIPQIAINKGGVARITSEKPLTATFAMSPGIKEDLLYAINTIFVDVDLVKERASLTVSELRYPLDGNLAKLDGDIHLDVGEITMRNGRPVSVFLKLLSNAASSSNEGGSEGRIEPLAIKINNGRLTYDKFGLKLFKLATPEGAPPQYANVIDMKGDVDLAKKVVNAITTKIPLTQFANYSGDVNSLFAKIGGRDGELAKTLTVGVTLTGPLYDEKGNFKELSQKIELPGIEDVAKNPGDLLKVLPGLIDSGKSGGGGAPNMPATDGGAKTEKPAQKPADKPAEKPKDKPADKPKEGEKPAKDASKDKDKDKPKKKKDQPKDQPKDPAKDPAKD